MIPVISGLIGLGQTWLENKAQKSKAKAEQETKLIEQAGSWDEIHAKGSQHSLKDEYWTLVFSIPLILVFFPSMVDPVMQGFQTLEKTPEWYRYSVMTLVAASVGMRQLTKIKTGGK